MRYSKLFQIALIVTSGACMSTAEDDLDTQEGAQGAEAADEADVALVSQELVFGNNDVGVIPGANNNCPFGMRSFWLDNEDSSNNNQRSGWIGSTVSNSNTTLRFCIAPGSSFKPVRSSNAAHNYAVLKLGPACPAGSVKITRRWDNEDTNNDTVSAIDEGGNYFEGGNLLLNFCMFRANANAATFTFANLGFSYGVLGGPGLTGALESGWVRTDDEDSSNNNQFYGDIAGSETFITTGSNTRLNMTRVR